MKRLTIILLALVLFVLFSHSFLEVKGLETSSFLPKSGYISCNIKEEYKEQYLSDQDICFDPECTINYTFRESYKDISIYYYDNIFIRIFNDEGRLSIGKYQNLYHYSRL